MKEIKHQTLLDFKAFNINENYIEFNDAQGYSIDGGIEIRFQEKIVTIGWSFDNECYEFREIPYSESYDFYELNLEKLNSIKGKRVKSLKFIETEFEVVLDYTMKTEKTKAITGFEIDFDDNFKLKVTSSFFEIDIENKLPINISPDIQGNLLIDIGNSFKYDNID